MRKLEYFEILFANDLAVFNAGSVLSGKVVILLNEAKKFESISIRFRGYAKTHWTRHQGKSSTHYTSQENYFDTIYVPEDYLDVLSNSQRLAAGRHEVAFEFQLPKNLPSSFEGQHGCIRYVCTAVLARTWKWNIFCKSAFTVIACEDLNLLPIARQPVHLEEISAVSCCCIRQGLISVALSLQKQGFVAGEPILLNCAIVNNSQSRVEKILARLKQYVVYKGESFWGFTDTKTTSTEVARLERWDSIQPGSEISWTNEPLVIPSLPPRLIGCGIIDVSYVLKFEVGSHTCCTIPLILGTIPISNRALNASVFDRNYQQLISASMGSMDPLAGLLPPPYSETPPPSYKECVMKGNQSIDDDDESSDQDQRSIHGGGERYFTPLYAYYSLAQ